MPRCIAAMLAAAFLTLPSLSAKDSSTPPKPAASWPHWRGPSGQGHTDDTRVPLTWSEKDNILWKVELPAGGNSTPIIWGDRIFLTGAGPRGSERQVFCLCVRDGKLLWKQTAARGVAFEKSHTWNGYASASCTTDGERVYAFFGTPGLFCYDLDGRLLWKHTFGIFTSQAGWGTAASPFLYEDLVIQNCDNDGPAALPPGHEASEAAPQALVALDKRTGEVRWTTPRNQGRGFSTPRLVSVAGGRVDLILNGPLGLWGYDPRTGKERWHCTRRDPRQQQRFGEPLPVNDGETLFVASGRPGPCQALRLPDSGDVTRSHVLWQKPRRGHRDVSSPILWQGRVYAADSKGVLTCYDLKTGTELYNERITPGKSLASPIAVRGKLLFVLDNGDTAVIEPGPALRVVRRNRLGSGRALDFVASPAVADGRLFLRSQTHLYCIGEKAEKPGKGVE